MFEDPFAISVYVADMVPFDRDVPEDKYLSWKSLTIGPHS